MRHYPLPWSAIFAALAILASQGLGHATPHEKEEQARPVLLVALPHDPFAKAIAVDLKHLGFEPLWRDPSLLVEVSAGSLAKAAASSHAVAAVYVRVQNAIIEIWVADRLTEKVLVREVPATMGSDIVAIKTVELLRASLLEMNVPAATLRNEEPPTEVGPSTTPSITPPPHRLALSLLPALSWYPGGLGMEAHAQVNLHWTGPRGLGANAFVAIPVLPAQHSRPSGTARLRSAWLGVAMRLIPTPSEHPWVLNVDAGISMVVLRVSATANSPFSARTVTSYAAVPYFKAGLAVSLTNDLALRLEGTVGIAVSEVAILFAGDQTATWGRPILNCAFGIEWRWPARGVAAPVEN